MPIESQYMTFYFMAIVMLFLSPFSRYSLSKYAWPRPLQWSNVRCNYAIQKLIYNFPYNGNNNLYHICYRMQGNHVRISEVSQIRIFDLRREGQGNDIKHRRWHVQIAVWMFECPSLCEKLADLSRPIFVWSINVWYIRTFYLSPKLMMGKFWVFKSENLHQDDKYWMPK